MTPPPHGSDERPASVRTVRSVEHAMALLWALRGAPGPLPLSQLARSVNLSSSSTLHLMRTLELGSLVMRDERGLYSLGWGVYELGMAVTGSSDLSKAARFHLDKLAEETGEAVLLGILDEDTVLYLDRGQVTQSWFAMTANAGRRSPLHTTATGKLLLAYLPAEHADRILCEPLQAATTYTITVRKKLTESLRDIRRQGFATCWQEQEIGLCSVAVPIRDFRDDVCAALTIAGPSARVTRSSFRRLLTKLQSSAREISARLGATDGLDGSSGRRT